MLWSEPFILIMVPSPRCARPSMPEPARKEDVGQLMGDDPSGRGWDHPRPDTRASSADPWAGRGVVIRTDAADAGRTVAPWRTC